MTLTLLSFSPDRDPRHPCDPCFCCSWEPIVTYVKDQYEKYLREELHVNRKRRIPDTRVHCCIYFLPATGHRSVPADSTLR